MKAPHARPVLALCGGIGGAKLALGLYRVLDPRQLIVVVNTGDDFEHLGLNICPDLDTVLYTLGGVADPERGWGRAEETWHGMDVLRQLGSETWFKLGDRDLAMHIVRTGWLRAGKSLTEFIAHAGNRLGISASILPMTDSGVRSVIETADGDLAFQDYFVRQRCEPVVTAIRFDGAKQARPAPGIAELIAGQSLRAIVICPSNPYLSVDPILAVPDIRRAFAARTTPVVAVSPIIGGHAVKGPTAKIMTELGIAITNQAIAAHYRGLIDGLVIDESDADDRTQINVPVLATRTIMNDMADRERLAGDVTAFADALTRLPEIEAAQGGQL
jgi:LPPG:FO 2-phospho-L-lactate transferase